MVSSITISRLLSPLIYYLGLYELTCKFAEFGKSLIHVFAPVLEDNISLVPTIMDESIKKILSYQGVFMNKMLKMNEEFQSKQIIIGYNNKPIEKDGVSTIQNEILYNNTLLATVNKT